MRSSISHRVDMRKAINALQGAAIIRSSIDETMVYAITSTARPDEINELLARSLERGL